MAEIEIVEARWPADRADVAALFREYGAYVASLGYDLAFQGFEAELAGLPGKYAPPEGLLLIARRAGAALGCVAYRPLSAAICEMKRLYVKPDARGSRLGETLCRVLMRRARAAGYGAMRLDTAQPMRRARELYLSLGFKPIAPYYDNPYPDMAFFEAMLEPDPHRASLGPHSIS